MSEDTGWDPLWFKKEAALSLERKIREAEEAEEAAAGDAFLIVTEGKVTEPCYFEALRADLQLPAVRVVVEPGDASHAEHVIETAKRLSNQHAERAKRGQLANNEPLYYDQVWAVIDSDVSERHKRWSDVVQLAVARGVKLASSTPCFEFWLLLHLREPTGPLLDCSAAKAENKKILGGLETDNEEQLNAALPKFMKHWPDAVRRAAIVRKKHAEASTPKPANPSTEVDRLARALNFAAPRHARKLGVSLGT